MRDSLDRNRIQSTFFSRRWVFAIAQEEPHESTCCAELSKRLAHIDPMSWRERFEVGGVYRNGVRAEFDSLLDPPCRLEYFELPGEPDSWQSLYPSFSPDMIVWRDDDMAVVFKPTGLPTTAPRDQIRYTLESYLRDFFGHPVHLPSRLDVAVSGLLIVSLRSRMHAALQRAYDARRVGKFYLAEIPGELPDACIDITSALARDPRHPLLRRVVTTGGEDAHTRVRGLRSYIRDGLRYSLVQAEPLTGRTHQIRAHLASIGAPIVGDPYYAGEEAPELRLASYGISLFHPFQQRHLEFQLSLARMPEWLHTIFRDESPPEIVKT